MAGGTANPASRQGMEAEQGASLLPILLMEVMLRNGWHPGGMLRK
jgi:hypothetical protein